MPQTGEVVTFSYDTMARRDIPTSPRIFRIRKDVSWEEVVQNYSREKKTLTGTHSLYSIILEVNN